MYIYVYVYIYRERYSYIYIYMYTYIYIEREIRPIIRCLLPAVSCMFITAIAVRYLFEGYDSGRV